ncbi:hypothetical protein ACLKA7_009528 [Drosophila subpalustris]
MLGGSSGERLCTPSTSAGPFRIFSVAGFQNRANDIVYCPPIVRQQSQHVEDSKAIIYFGGDVQDFPESMETNRDSRGYMKYNLENSAILLREAFPRSHIIVIRPVRMEFKTFSCFDNFVRGNNAGVPDHTPMNHALQHLEKLLQNLSQRLISIPENEILDQAAQAAAAAAAVAAAAAAAALTLSNAAVNSESTSASSTAGDNSQEMDIDILQVQENVTVDADGAVIFPIVSAGATETAAPINNVAGNVNNGNNKDAAVNSHQESNNQQQQQSTVKATSTSTTTATTNNVEHCNNSTNNSNDCAASQPTLPTQPQQLRPPTSQQSDNNPLWWRENLNLDKSKLVLIGFSKGCVVLNQFIYEFHYLKTLTPDDSSMCRLLSRITDMYWLDGGHGGQKNTWITSRSLLETLTRMGMNIHVHLTPYQVQDDRRPWIRKEEKLFTEMLRRLNAPITRHLHYDNQPANLMTHFEVLQAFCQHVHSLNQQQQLQQQHGPNNEQPNVATNNGAGSSSSNLLDASEEAK